MDKFGQPIYESGPEFLQNLSLYPWQVQQMVNYARNRPALDIITERFGGVAPSPPSNIFGEKQTQYFTDDGEIPMHVVDGKLIPNMKEVKSVEVPVGPFTSAVSPGLLNGISEPEPTTWRVERGLEAGSI